MWKDLSNEWKAAFEQAWSAFCCGSIPIGAVIADSDGKILIAGRNETCENHYPNKKTAHAEMYCVRNLDIEKYRDYYMYHLYTTMEPCPMCMGTIVMGGIRNIHVAARDNYCGALHFINDDPYIKSKNNKVFFAPAEAEFVQLVQQGYHELKRFNGKNTTVLDRFREYNSRAVAAANDLYEEKYLDECILNSIAYPEIYDTVCRMFPA